jgi:hypothetical protein
MEENVRNITIAQLAVGCLSHGAQAQSDKVPTMTQFRPANKNMVDFVSSGYEVKSVFAIPGQRERLYYFLQKGASVVTCTDVGGVIMACGELVAPFPFSELGKYPLGK